EANAIEAYSEVCSDDPTELLKSLMTRDSDNEIIRRAALRALGKHAKIETLDLLMEYMGPKKPRECRGAAVEAIASLIEREEPGKETEKKVIEAISKCLKKGNRRLQIGAMMALEKLGPKAKSALPDIDRLAKTGGPRAKSMAMRVAKKIRGEGGPGGGGEVKDLKDRLAKLEGENRRLKDRVQKLESRGSDEGGDDD
ncbi:MAG TPA: HEAT repeat domain-containing protein, partial [Phycisphaerae bacterium]|nr:HEAT repeat domain-containing protein [Phycisphaerae bacterium]